MADRDIEEIAQRVMRYLRAHPNAADSARGVAAWWVGPGVAEPSLERVERALEWLVSEDAVCRRVLPDGSAIYSAGPAVGRGGDPGAGA